MAMVFHGGFLWRMFYGNEATGGHWKLQFQWSNTFNFHVQMSKDISKFTIYSAFHAFMDGTTMSTELPTRETSSLNILWWNSFWRPGSGARSDSTNPCHPIASDSVKRTPHVGEHHTMEGPRDQRDLAPGYVSFRIPEFAYRSTLKHSDDADMLFAMLSQWLCHGQVVESGEWGSSLQSTVSGGVIHEGKLHKNLKS